MHDELKTTCEKSPLGPEFREYRKLQKATSRLCGLLTMMESTEVSREKWNFIMRAEIDEYIETVKDFKRKFGD